MTERVIILQARTGSSRLPGKALLPVGGLPAVVLAAKRASNAGVETVVATSNDNSDDELARIVETYGFPVFRGSLSDTLQRIVQALAGRHDDTIVVRITADNVFPDGRFIGEMVDDLTRRGLQYISSTGDETGLPYGMSAEAMYLRDLREADARATSRDDREHVTPYLIRRFGSQQFTKYRRLFKGSYRCTIDYYNDYQNVLAVFAAVDDPAGADFLELITRLDRTSARPINGFGVPRLVFGTAQIGFHYGIANTSGPPDVPTVSKMIRTAIDNGIRYVDTATAYGDSERVIGDTLRGGQSGQIKMITKLSPMSDCPGDAPAQFVRQFVDASVYRSVAMLGTWPLDVLLLHRTGHLKAWGGCVWDRLREHRNSGLVEKLGVSVQNPAELEAALDDGDVNFVQLPYNMLDWRWDALVQKVERIKKTRDLTVHARSGLLQGLIPSRDPALWRRANVMSPQPVIDWIEKMVATFGRDCAADLALSYVNATAWIDGVVVGMETIRQLTDNITMFGRPALSFAELDAICQDRPVLSEATLDPTCWKMDAS